MEMLEKAARAIARTTLSPHGVGCFDADPAYYRHDFSQSERDDFEECARAVIAAMREPSQAMLDASPRWSSEALPEWQKMVDAALAK